MIEQTTMKASYHSNKIHEKPRVWCDHCNKPQNTRETCRKLYGKPANGKSFNQGERFPPTPQMQMLVIPTCLTREQIDQILKRLKTTSYGNPSVSLTEFGNYPQALSCINTLKSPVHQKA